jgi:hypothetical protein
MLLSLSGCGGIGPSNTTVDNEVSKQLQEKYNKSFTVYAAGNRFNNTTATAYVFADDDPTMMFTTRISDDGELVFENYVYRLVCRDVENIVNETFKVNGIDSECFAVFFDTDSRVNIQESEISIDDFIEEFNPKGISISILARDSDVINSENILKIYDELFSKLRKLDIGTNLCIASSEDFDKVVEDVKRETQLFDAYRVEVKGIENNVHEMNVRMTSEGLFPTTNEIDEKLSKFESVAGGDN